jgi:hypothetical protein
MNDAILKFITSSGGYVTFTELATGVPGFVGDRALGLQSNVILWHAVSVEALEALNYLRDSELIALAPARVEVYDGQIVPGYPDANHDHLANGGMYEEPHWAPAYVAVNERPNNG